jgi:hypothetical protein
VALAALGRPGPLKSGGTREYIERKHGRMPMPQYHPLVMEVLGETFGVIIYQEQVMQLMRVAGLDWPDVHKIRKLISKSGGTQVLEQYHHPYLRGMADAGIGEEEAEHLWVQCQEAGNYVFNKAHGAQYAVHAYWTAYLKSALLRPVRLRDGEPREEGAAAAGAAARVQSERGNAAAAGPEPIGDEVQQPGAQRVILGGFQSLKGVGEIAAKELLKGQPYADWTEFLLKCPPALARDLQAAGLPKGPIDLDVALALAPWFVEIDYSPFETEVFNRMRCTPIAAVQDCLHGGYGGRVMRLFGRITEVEIKVAKTEVGLAERAQLTLTDPTGSVPIWYRRLALGRESSAAGSRSPARPTGSATVCWPPW